MADLFENPWDSMALVVEFAGLNPKSRCFSCWDLPRLPSTAPRT